MIEKPNFGNYLNWQHRKYSEKISRPLKEWLLEELPYEVTNEWDDHIDLRDIGDLVEGHWSAFSGENNISHYFFEFESDAMAFKLKWL